jgi:photosystem II stability/assembly factor-like uncharacterized protein
MKSIHIRLVIGSQFFLLLLISCCERHEVNSSDTVLPPQQTGKDLKKFENFSNSKRGKVLSSEASDWKTTRTNIGNREPISAITFINERVGWACSKKKIYKTEDSGETWKSFKIDFVGKGTIGFFQFTNDLQGWLIIEEANRDNYSKNDRIRIYRTADSGKSWKLTHSEMSISFRDAQFTNENGWLVGMKFVRDGASERAPFVLYFSNQSDVWTDVSDPVKNLSYDPDYRAGDLPSLNRLTIKDANCVVAVNKPGKIFQSCDRGKNWQILDSLDNFPPQSSYGPQQIGFQHDFIWTIESAGAIDGLGTILTIIPLSEYGEKQLLSLPNYIRQGFAVSASEFFLVGESNDVSKKGQATKGIILHTTDSGETWKKILSIPQEVKSTQFFPSQKLIWILTADGELDKATS